MKKKRQQDYRTRYADNPLVQAFAVRLMEWRQGKGLTLKTMASKLGVSVSIICEWEHGCRFPSVQHLMAIATYTKIPAAEFLRTLKGTAKEPKGGKSRR